MSLETFLQAFPLPRQDPLIFPADYELFLLTFTFPSLSFQNGKGPSLHMPSTCVYSPGQDSPGSCTRVPWCSDIYHPRYSEWEILAEFPSAQQRTGSRQVLGGMRLSTEEGQALQVSHIFNLGEHRIWDREHYAATCMSHSGTSLWFRLKCTRKLLNFKATPIIFISPRAQHNT